MIGGEWDLGCEGPQPAAVGKEEGWGYWRRRIPEEMEGSGILAWNSSTGTGTTNHREKTIGLKGVYRARWREYSNPSGSGNTRFRYFLVRAMTQD